MQVKVHHAALVESEAIEEVAGLLVAPELRDLAAAPFDAAFVATPGRILFSWSEEQEIPDLDDLDVELRTHCA